MRRSMMALSLEPLKELLTSISVCTDDVTTGKRTPSMSSSCVCHVPSTAHSPNISLSNASTRVFFPLPGGPVKSRCGNEPVGFVVSRSHRSIGLHPKSRSATFIGL